MDAPTPIVESGIEELYERRGEGYPLKSDSISTPQDRQDWILVARDIITKGGTRPGQVRYLAALSGVNMITVIRSYSAKKPQLSLRSILLSIINSSRHEWTNTPTVEEYRRLFEEMNPEPPSPALLARGLKPKIISQPIVIPRHGHTGGLRTYTRARVASVLISPEDIQPGGQYDIAHFDTLTPKQKEVMRILAGYTIGPENVPTSYTPNVHLTISDIARQLNKNNANIHTLIWQIRKRIADIHATQGTLEPEGETDAPEEHLPSQQVNAPTLSKRNDLSIFPAHLIQYIGVLSAVQRADFHAFYGFKGNPNGSTSPSSYDEKRRKSYEEIAQNRNVGKGAVHVSISTGYRRLQQCAMAAQESAKTNTTQIRQGSKPAKYTPDKLPNLAGILDLFPYLRSAIFAWYGYDGAGDPTDPSSYGVARAKTSQKIADETGVPLARVQTYLCIARKALGWPEEQVAQASPNQSTLLERFVEPDPAVREGSASPRRIPAPIPKRPSTVTPAYTGETGVTGSSLPGARVIKPPREISQPYMPSTGPVFKSSSTSSTGRPIKKIIWKPRNPQGHDLSPDNRFAAILEKAPAGIIPAVPILLASPEIQAIPPREIPEFTSYREALEWGQQQEDWIWGIALWKNSTPLTQIDDMGANSFLKSPTYLGLKTFLDKVRDLSGKPHFRYTKIFDAMLEPLPEEKIGLAEIQRNPQWMH